MLFRFKQQRKSHLLKSKSTLLALFIVFYLYYISKTWTYQVFSQK